MKNDIKPRRRRDVVRMKAWLKARRAGIAAAAASTVYHDGVAELASATHKWLAASGRSAEESGKRRQASSLHRRGERPAGRRPAAGRKNRAARCWR